MKRVSNYWPSVLVMFVTAILLTFIQIKVPMSMLLLERYIHGGAWIEIIALTIYAGWIFRHMRDPIQSPRWRLRIWLAFSIVFFGQLILGLFGMELMLMTGKLHLPVPAMIVAGPLFRGERFFMPILFLSTVLLVGPAWCSHLCYVGAWDGLAASRIFRPKRMPRWRRWWQVIILLLIIAGALLLRLLGVSTFIAVWFGAGIGIVGVGIILLLSQRKGVMVHCTAFCPIGLLATWLGKMNPFRIRINDSCTECGHCTMACRYDALDMQDIRKRRPGSSCTLCGDCLGLCRDGALEYHFLRMNPARARSLFLGIVIILHTVFLGVARI